MNLLIANLSIFLLSADGSDFIGDIFKSRIEGSVMMHRLVKAWQNNKSLIVFISLMFVFRSAVADWSDVPTGSMKPTILEGDRILVNKMAYDVRLPFTHTSLIKLSDPQRNDIIIFDSKISDKRLVKRVIGVPGDIISMKDNVLTINGQTLSYQQANEQDKIEQLPNHQHQIRTLNNNNRFASFEPVTVPEKQYLVLGDNRDNSADSRFIGFVPRKEIVGRSSTVVVSLDYDNYFIPRSERFFHSL